jgi:hypothetical protein
MLCQGCEIFWTRRCPAQWKFAKVLFAKLIIPDCGIPEFLHLEGASLLELRNFRLNLAFPSVF